VTGIADRYDDKHLIAPSGEAITSESESSLLAFNSSEHAASWPPTSTSTD